GALERRAERAEHGIPAVLDGLQLGRRHGRARSCGEQSLPAGAARRDVAAADRPHAAIDEDAQASLDPRALPGEALALVLDDGEAGPRVETEEEHLQRVGIDLTNGGATKGGPPARAEGIEGIVFEERPGKGLETRIARRAVRRGVEAPEDARYLVVAAAAAIAQSQQRRVDAHDRATVRHAPGNPREHRTVARQRVRRPAKLERETRALEASPAGLVAILPREVDAEEPHGSGTAMLPANTVTAEPPTRTRVTLPSWSWSSTRSRPGRPRPSPCSAVKSARVPLGWRSPAS